VLGRALVDLIAPRRCAGCFRIGDGWCALCHADLARLRLRDAGWSPLGDGVLAIGAYAYAGPVAAAVKRAKTPGGHALAPDLAAVLWPAVGIQPSELPRTWVPSAPARAKARGAELPQVLAGPGAVRLLERHPAARKQTGLAPDARRAAPRGTFRVVTAPPPVVVLIDDVRTTGATALAAAATLRAAGARRVLVVTLCVAGGRSRADDPTAPRTAR